MSNLEPQIFCDYEQSTINPNLYVCKYCKTVVTSLDTKSANTVCHYRIEQAALDPRFEQIKLVKTIVETPDGETIAEYKHNPESLKKAKILSDWWFGQSIEEKNQVAPINKSIPKTHTNTDMSNHCTQEEIDSRLSICQTCEFYKNNTCLKCGCSLSRERNFMNKLYWKDKSCPIGKWGPVE